MSDQRHEGRGPERRLDVAQGPAFPISRWLLAGLRFSNERVTGLAKAVKRSTRRSLESVDAIDTYPQVRDPKVERLDRGFAWLDTGTVDSITLDAWATNSAHNFPNWQTSFSKMGTANTFARYNSNDLTIDCLRDARHSNRAIEPVRALLNSGTTNAKHFRNEFNTDDLRIT